MATLTDEEYEYKPINSGYSFLSDYGIEGPPVPDGFLQQEVQSEAPVTYAKLVSLHGDQLSINGIKFKPVRNSPYMFDYRTLVEQILDGEREEIPTLRELCKKDLWFLTYFILGNPIANDDMNHWVKMCRMIQTGPKDKVLDMWAREHGKTTLLTVNSTIQDLIINPDETIAIFSYTRDAARVFFREIRQQLESNQTLYQLFPEILWATPPHKGVQWNDDGITVKRQFPQKECSVEPWGLLEGMPTGRHFSKMKFDDISTQDLADSPVQMERMKEKFDMAMNVGKDGGTVTVTGTPYHHEDVLSYIRKKVLEGKPMFAERLITATDDGSFTGKSIYLSEDRLNLLRQNRRFFNSQQLLNPTPDDDVKLPYSMINHIRESQVPKEIIKVMIIDPAGAKRKDGRRNDAWAMWVVGMERKLKMSGVFNIYILDGCIGRFRMEEAINEACKIYLRNNFIRQLAIEKVGLSTMEIHLSNALRAKGRIVTVENKQLRVVTPGNRPKRVRIEGNLATPLYNGAIHLVDSINPETKSELREEMEKYGAYHDDGLDALAYGYDLLSEYAISLERVGGIEKPVKPKRDPYDDDGDKKLTLSWMSR